ncbi:hypothetical protein QYE76_049362 [Lolium multiflorum]|uniref:Uncharacterized protein n=1 Tax=Lolium multiflorum TaxID=4521 RepID=A0AAD8SPZ3_LOLMU|nr:hypothetical protein QYE76_049362 [Lolium multiflorum]
MFPAGTSASPAATAALDLSTGVALLWRSSRTLVSHNPPFPWYPPAVDTPSLLSLNLVDLSPARSSTTCCSRRPPASEAKNPCGGEREALRTCYPVHPAAAANMVCPALPGPAGRRGLPGSRTGAAAGLRAGKQLAFPRPAVSVRHPEVRVLQLPDVVMVCFSASAYTAFIMEPS